jgi:hypothetical protein
MKEGGTIYDPVTGDKCKFVRGIEDIADASREDAMHSMQAGMAAFGIRVGFATKNDAEGRRDYFFIKDENGTKGITVVDVEGKKTLVRVPKGVTFSWKEDMPVPAVDPNYELGKPGRRFP